MIFLVLGGSVVVFWLDVFVLRRWAASAVSYTFLLLTLVTIVYGAIFAEETITLRFVVGGAIIVAGVWIGALAPGRRTRPVEPTAARCRSVRRPAGQLKDAPRAWTRASIERRANRPHAQLAIAADWRVSLSGGGRRS